MAQREWVVSISALTIIAGLKVVSPAAAVENAHDCTGSPPDAVMTLPAPLSKWGRIVCTPYGHMLAGRDGWMWIMPEIFETVLIPAQVPEKEPEQVGNKIYFTKVDVYKVKGSEFDNAYKVFHTGFDDKEVKPDGYRVELTTDQGKSLMMYFFDYDTYAWGMSCPDSKCEMETRFMILDKNTPPKPREPSI